MTTVAHLMEVYLGATETFIHDALVSFRTIRPVVIAGALENLERFPLPSGTALHLSPPRRGSLAWAGSAIRRRLRGGAPHLEGIVRRERAAILHAHFGPAGAAAVALKHVTGLPLVTSFYGYDASIRHVLDEMAQGYRALFAAGDLFLAEGSAMKSRLERLGCPASRIRIQRIGIDPARYRFSPRSAPDGGPVRLLACGRLVPKKGHATTLAALAQARRDGASLSLTILGDGPERPALERRIRELGLDREVTLLGATPRSEFLLELERAHIYIQASLTAPDGDSEGGAPTTLLEAQACGLPVLSTRHADIPEVVVEGESALLSDEGDASGLAANLASLAADPGRWAAMGRAGRAHVERHHDARELAARLEGLYGTLAGARARLAGP